MELKKLPIPKSFMMHGQVVTVEYDSKLGNIAGNRGEDHNGYNRIILQPGVEGDPRPQSWVEQAFLHELTHEILYHMESKFNDDEKFVNLFASLLHEALVTAEYEEEKNGKKR